MKIRQKKKLLKALEGIEDFRKHKEQIVYPLSEVLFVSLFGLVKGYINFKDLYTYYKFNKNNKLLKKLFKTKKIRVPCKSTFHRILSNVSYDGLEVVFRDFFGKYAKGRKFTNTLPPISLLAFHPFHKHSSTHFTFCLPLFR